MTSETKRIPWLRVLVEGVVIVSSILLAFAIDAWWDGRRDQMERVELLEALVGDFGAARAILADRIEREAELEGRTRALLAASGRRTHLPADSIQYLAFALVTGAGGNVAPSVPRYDAAVASGRLGMISDDSLLVALGSFDLARRNHVALVERLRERFYSGGLDDLRRELGTLAVLNPVAARSEPPDRFVPDDLNELIQRRLVYATAEAVLASRVNLRALLEAMDRASERVLTAIHMLRE